MRRTGYGWATAGADSVWHTLKPDRISLEAVETREHVETAVLA